MSRSHTKVEIPSEEVFRRKAAEKTDWEITNSYGPDFEQIRNLVKRQNRDKRKICEGYIPLSKGRPRKNPADEATRRNNELAELRMQMELMQNLLSEAGRR